MRHTERNGWARTARCDGRSASMASVNTNAAFAMTPGGLKRDDPEHSPRMNTAFALLARFESPTVKLEDICAEYFGMDKEKAYQLAAVNELPVPTFRAGSQKSPR